MVEYTTQVSRDDTGQYYPRLCPTCNVEREFIGKTFRWNFTGADANESAVFVRMYECVHCGTVLNTRGLALSKNGKLTRHDESETKE